MVQILGFVVVIALLIFLAVGFWLSSSDGSTDGDE
jgi:uncharacterized protein YneF (UPF0154 family)